MRHILPFVHFISGSRGREEDEQSGGRRGREIDGTETRGVVKSGQYGIEDGELFFAMLRLELHDADKCFHRNDEKTAAEYQLEGGATLHLVLALRGGR